MVISLRFRAIALPIIISSTLLMLDCDDKQATGADCYSLTMDITGAGTVQQIPDSTCYHTGTLITLTAVAVEGNIFNRWTGDVVRYDNPYQLSLIRNTSLTANFMALYSISIDMEPADAGIVYVDPDQEYYATGDSVGLWAVPDSGFVFADWIINDDTTETNPAFIVIQLENIMATARFTEAR